jgi:5'(3')-deoxyribonucleotidase
MRRLVIAVDFDDVLVDSSKVLPEIYNEKFGTDLRYEDMYVGHYGRFGVSTQAAAIQRLHSVMQCDAYTGLKPSIEVVEVVRRLASQHELHVITGRAGFLEPYTRAILDSNFPDCFTSLEHTNHFDDGDTTVVRRSKAQVCKQIGVDMLIDDLPLHVEQVLQSGVGRVVLFGEYPWNQSSAMSNGMSRCRTWGEVEKVVAACAAD